MFCPNCGAKNKVEQNYCRGCGLKLAAIVELVSEQFPSREHEELQRRTERFEKFGMYSLTVAGLIGLVILLFKVTQFKLILFGPDFLLGSAIAALIGFLLLSLFFIHYPKFIRVSSPHVSKGLSGTVDGANPVTAKLLEDRPPDYVSSVTEDTTRTLKAPRSTGAK
ncbi:MAG: zinc-ribbon domain-containing protein [Pyrinomonadaceae bacterium]